MFTDQESAAAPASGTAERRPVSHGYRMYAMGFLFVTYMFNFVDRQILVILAEAIKTDLGLADWQIGVLAGLAFALFFSIMGIPIARLADRYSRTMIIAASLAIWSLFTVFCSQARSFTQLALFRVGVGVGEAGCNPAAHSLITDYVPRSKRARALAIYSMANPIGILLGMALGGLIAQKWGWRAAFVVAGAPGLVLALIAVLTLRETRAKLPPNADTDGTGDGGFGGTMRQLLPKPSYWLITFAFAGVLFVAAPFQAFAAPFFLRNHTAGVAQLAAAASEQFGLSLAPIGFLGLALGLASGLGGALGVLVGGMAADRLGRGDARGYLVGPALACLMAGPASAAAFMVADTRAALLLWGIAYFMLQLPTAPVFAAVQTIAPPGGRATSAAIHIFTINLFGIALGPLATGVLSDLFNTGAGLGPASGLRYALISMSIVAPVSAAIFWMARRTFREDCVG